ncbi:MAG: hypothetical protein ACSLFH_03965 [Desulfuromonadales bacterium]
MNAMLKMTHFGLLSLLILCTSCAATSNQFVGNSVAPQHQVVALQPGGASAGLWQTFDIVINYQYKRVGDLFEFSGAAELTPRYEMLYENLRDLRVFLFFLDDKAHVLRANMLARSLTNRVDERLGFTRLYNIPPGTASITFGYDGNVSEAGMRRWRGGKSFYMLPLGK